jgi:ABC-type transport system substrate-binding protein
MKVQRTFGGIRRSVAVALVGMLTAACLSAPPASQVVLRVGQFQEISTLDPAIGYDIYAWPWERLIFETLIGYDEGAVLVPRLAEAMPAFSDDGRTLSFTLRPGVNFVTQDGSVMREVVADDFVYSLNRVLNPNLKPSPSPVADAFFAAIEGAGDVLEGRSETASGLRAIDERTLEITISGPDPTFLHVLALPFAAVVPRELAGTDTAAFSLSPVGTGPFLLAEWTPAQRARFVSNPHYWNGEFSGPAEIEVRLGLDADSQLQQVQTGSLDVMTDSIPPGQFAAVVADPRWAEYLKRAPQITTNFLAMDTSQDGPLGDTLVRQAISHAVDKDNIIRIKNGRGVAATCIFPPLLPGYDPGCDPYPHDVQRAQELMSDAGYGEGFTTKLYGEDSDIERQVAQALQQDLAAIGIRAELVPQPIVTLLDSAGAQGQAPLFLLGWAMDFPDPANFIEPVLTCASIGGFNPAWYCNDAVDRLAQEARAETDLDRRLEIYREIQRLVMDDAPWVTLDHPEIAVLVHPSVSNFALHPVWRFDHERYLPVR